MTKKVTTMEGMFNQIKRSHASIYGVNFAETDAAFLSPAYKTVFREGSLRYCPGLLGSDGHDVLRQLLQDQDAYRKCMLLRKAHGPFTIADASKYFDIALLKSTLKNIASASVLRKTGTMSGK